MSAIVADNSAESLLTFILGSMGGEAPAISLSPATISSFLVL